MAVRSMSRRGSEFIAIASFIAWAVSAQAQEKAAEPKPDERLQEVVITGSRIARPDLDRLQPTTVVGSDVFDERGYSDVGQALQDVPAFGVPPVSAANQQAAFGIAQSFVDLYSLGSQRTLTLVDGRRFVSSNTPSLNGPASPGQQVDLNVVPTKLIDRVETVSVGGAPIYGADAIAGTVNIILKHDFEGLDIDAQGGESSFHDAANYRVRALAGVNFADRRGNLTGVAEFSKSDGLLGTDRRIYAQDLQFEAPATPGPIKLLLIANGAVSSISTSGVPYVDDFFYTPGPGGTAFGVTNAGGKPLAFSPGSSALSPYNLGTATGDPVFWQGGDGIRLSQFSNLLSPDERMNLDTLGNFKFTDHVTGFMEGWFSETHATNLISQPMYNTFLFGPAGSTNGNLVISAHNPYLSAADQVTIQNALNNWGAFLASPAGQAAIAGGLPHDPNWDGTHFYMGRASTDLQSGAATATQVVTRGVLGVKGDFSIADKDWNWEAAFNYGYSRNQSLQPSVVFQNLQNALNSTVDASGNIVCAGNPVAAPVSTYSSTCAPLNPFGLGSPSQQARNYITHDALATSIDTQRDATINFTGPIIKLPADDLKIAIGFENRRETANFQPDSFYTVPYGGSFAAAVAGDYHTNEVYAETLIPIFEPAQDIPFMHRLEPEAAVRRVDNSIAGSATTWTAGLHWAPVEDLTFRGNKTRSIRAPAITELFLPQATAFEFANDPCDKNFVDQGTAPATRAKNCAAAGINTSTFTSNVVNATARGITSGNPDLTSETADSLTYGFVLRPRWVPKLNISIDYIRIDLTNAIEQLNLVEILDACYDAANYPADPSCSQFTRNAQGQITSFHDGFVNAGLLNFTGVSVAFDWTMDLPKTLGSLQWRVNYLNTRTLVSKVASASANNIAGELGQGAGTTVAMPNGKGVLDLTYKNGAFEFFWQALYVGGLNFSNTNTATSQNILSVSPWWLMNSTLTYNITHEFTMRLIVDNVFDKQPPYPALAGTGGNFLAATTLYFPGIIGRTYLVSADYRF